MVEKEIVLNDIPVTIAGIAKVCKGGRITIPQYVRQSLGIGDQSRAAIYFNREKKILFIEVID
ncbi:hypothetical protein [Archaeoglobus neptunius]|uniref:hypothetical protein n=1 Tax=Archaeoglobus neptunius TaxID=2798580 RepID=UPI001927B597|nr:hypothetical protein [Archaeoglobus neptunius]